MIRWVREAGAIARERFGSAVVSRKADRSPVTDADHAVQEALLTAIGRAYPADATITEETQADPGRHAPAATASRCWVIDPIDGTRNYARGFPVFTISVALLEAGSPVVGVVYEPLSDRVYSATRGGGAFSGEQRLGAAGPTSGRGLFMGIPTSRDEKLPPVVHGWIDRMTVRNLGSTALHLVLLASGGLDAVYCKRCRLWDIAAGALLVTETAQKLVPLRDTAYFPLDPATYHNEMMPFIAGRPDLVDQLVDEYRKAREADTGTSAHEYETN